jgi:DNA mismatch endonuclease (patch repair protein)
MKTKRLTPQAQRQGDVMSVAQRSALMARIKGRDTGPERQVAAMLARLRVRSERHCRDLPGRPDFVLRRRRIVVFVDGDFWHGWRFPQWESKLAPFWAAKIRANRARDLRNHARLRRAGWTLVRVWEHQLKRDPLAVAARIAAVLDSAPSPNRRPGFSREAQ